MVRFLEHREPDLAIEAIDIDPQMIAIADRYFGTRGSERVKLAVADGYQVIRSAGEPWDVIFMDAFLRPSDETDGVGNPLRMKEGSFYAAVRARLAPGGVAAFNLNPQPQRERDLAELRQAFPQVYVFECDGAFNWVAIATLEPARRSGAELEAAAATLEPRFEGEPDFRAMLGHLQNRS
jgi:spermidine synthase